MAPDGHLDGSGWGLVRVGSTESVWGDTFTGGNELGFFELRRGLVEASADCETSEPWGGLRRLASLIVRGILGCSSMNSSAWIVLSLVFAGVGLAAGEAPAAARAGDLVRLLGDPSYAVRVGRSAAEELKKGLADADPEVRRRCRYLYPLALRSDDATREAALKKWKERGVGKK